MPGLRITERRRLAFIGFNLGSFYAVHRIGRHGILLTKVFKQRREGGELAPQGAAGERTSLKVLPPGQNVRAADQPEFLRRVNPDEAHEFLQVVAPTATT